MNYVLFITSILFFAGNAHAQNQQGAAPFTIGVIDKIVSAKLSETRTLNIYLPEGYNKADSFRYPVIYLLDGSANEDFIHTAGLVQYLAMYELIKPSIVVGIANIDRRRDFTFPSTVKSDLEKVPTSGGSSKFIAFIEQELQPYIDKRYKTNNYKTIIGQSLGGLLATEILLKNPAMFNDYMIVSPSLWWNDGSLLKAAPALLKQQQGTVANVYLSVGTEGKEMEEGAKNLLGILQNSGNSKLKIFFAPFPEESHLTILHRSLYKGFELLNQKK